MEYTESEKQAALAWADTFGKWEGVEGIPDRHCATLAAALRQAEATVKLQIEMCDDANRIRHEALARAEKAESRLKTLEEENARMRGVVDAAKDECRMSQYKLCAALDRLASLKQEAE